MISWLKCSSLQWSSSESGAISLALDSGWACYLLWSIEYDGSEQVTWCVFWALGTNSSEVFILPSWSAIFMWMGLSQPHGEDMWKRVKDMWRDIQPKTDLLQAIFSEAIQTLFNSCLIGESRQSQCKNLPAEPILNCWLTESWEDKWLLL